MMKLFTGELCLLLTLSVNLYSFGSFGDGSDSIKIKSGKWIKSMITTYDHRALYLIDDNVIMFKVVSEVRTSNELLATNISTLFNGSVIRRVDDRWSVSFDSALIPKGEIQTSNILSTKNLLFTATTARSKNYDIQLDFDQAFNDWTIFQLAFSGGIFTSNEIRAISGPSKIFYSPIKYHAYQLVAGIGLESNFLNGRASIISSAGYDVFGGSVTTAAGTKVDLFESTGFLNLITLHYVRTVFADTFFLSVDSRYYFSNVVIDGKVDRFVVGLGIGLAL